MNGRTDRRIVELAGRQYGVVTRQQLLDAGVTARMVQRRLDNGLLEPIHRGVYRMGPLRSARAREMAAVLACGDEAVLSHRDAAALWGLLPHVGDARPVDVSVRGTSGGSGKPGIRLHRVVHLPGTDRLRRGLAEIGGEWLHRVVHLPGTDRAVVDGIPVTTAERTLLDLAGLPARARRPRMARVSRSRTSRARGPSPRTSSTSSGPRSLRTSRAQAFGLRELEQAIAKADRMGLVDLDELRARVAGRPGRHGTAILRAILDGEGGPRLTRSEAEERFLALIRRAQLPMPQVNARVGRYEVDFLWRSLGIGVEVDGFGFHSSRDRFEGDRRRDQDLAASGVHVTRVTWRQIVDEPTAVLGRVAQALGQAAGR